MMCSSLRNINRFLKNFCGYDNKVITLDDKNYIDEVKAYEEIYGRNSFERDVQLLSGCSISQRYSIIE